MLTTILRRLAEFRGSRKGNMATMFALSLPIGLAAAALAVDEGSLYVERREAQSVTDLAAIYAAANIAKADAAVLKVFTNNRQKNVVLVGDANAQSMTAGYQRVLVEKGRYAADPTVAASTRFVVGATPPNAVRVTYSKDGTTYFANALMGDRKIVTTAVATAPAEAAFSVGSRLASLNGGLLNSVLGGLLGTTLSLNVMDYNALLGVDVNALQFIDALKTELNLTAGTYSEVLQAEATVGQILSALATVTKDRDADIALAKLLGAHIPGSLKVPLANYIDLGAIGKLSTGRGAAGLDANVGIMELLGAAAAIANGKNQVAVDLGAGVPGLVSVKLNVAIGEPPQGYSWFAVGEPGKIVRTAQTRLQLVVTVGGSGGLVDSVLGGSVRVPLYVELAYAEAQLKSVSCPTGKPASAIVTVAAQPGVAEIWLGDINPAELKVFTKRPVVQPAQLVKLNPVGLNVLTVDVKGAANVRIGNMTPTTLTFNKSDIDTRKIKSVSTRNLTQSLTASLLSGLTLDIELKVLGLGLGLFVPTDAAVKSAIVGLLSGVTAPIDDLLYNVLSLVGVKVGEADVRVHGVNCGRSVLVL
ncbi:hypothetical protein J1C56_07075 [Aminobacter anthyllidis]|uniref:DUF2134 domain-containing protein n=2 Tax=Aminobacter anthyllidis TaxID=1035067 RepID=A0A9X1A942_9HYPH|nr:hypothetical protein [Aminobacter anthyllidis]